MEETTDDLNEEQLLNTSVILQTSSSAYDGQQSSSNAALKKKKVMENCVPWRYCLSQLQRCKDAKNKTQFRELIDKYSKSHFQQRKTDALAKGRLIWTDFEERYGTGDGETWLEVEADLIAREDPFYSFVNILVKADPKSGVPCRALKRVNGECRGHPEHSIKTVKDPRSRLKRTPRTVPLLIPKYTLDDCTAFAPPRREIAFAELNDNVNYDYLHEFCCAKGKREVTYLQIYTDPTNRSHLGMALAEFKTTQQAMDFYEQCGPNPKIMGFSSKIFVDTLGFWIIDEFARLTGQEPPTLPPRRTLFTDDRQLLRIRELIHRQNLKDGVRDNHQNTPSDTYHNEMETTKPAGARTPIEDMPSSSASINSLSRSTSNEPIDQIEEVNEPKQQNGQSPINANYSLMANGHAKRRQSQSPSRSRPSREHQHHNGRSHSSSRRHDDFDSHNYRDRKRRLNTRDDKYSSKYRRRDFSISPDRTKSSYKSSRKRSVSSSSTRSNSSDSYRNRSKRTYNNRDRSTSKTRRSDSRSEKLSEVSQPADPINLCVQPPPAPYDLSLPFTTAYPPPFFPHFFPAPPFAEPKSIDSIPTIAEDAPVRLKPVQRELGPYFVLNRADRTEFFKQMRSAGHYNEHGTFVIPTLRLYEENVCSFLVTEFFVELDHLQEPAPIDSRITKIEKVKEQLKEDLLLSLKASMCQKIETLVYKEVDRLHAEYEAKQKLLDEEKSKMKRPETKQIFDFEEQFSNSSMVTRSVFGSNRMLQFNRNIFATKKIPKKSGETVTKKQEKSVHHKKSVEMEAMRKESKKIKMESPSSYKSPSSAVRSGSRASTASSVKRSPRSPSAQSISSTLSDDSSLSSPTNKLSSSEVSDNEEAQQKRIIASTSSSASVSQPTSPKASNAEPADDAEMDSLQITQSRTMRKVDYCEDNSSESEGDSDWAEQFGMRNEHKEGKKLLKKHKEKSRPQEKEESSDSDESNDAKERPKKSKSIVAKEETTEFNEQDQPEKSVESVRHSIPPPKTPPEISEPASPIVMPSTIKVEPQVEIRKEPEVVASVVEKVLIEKPPIVQAPEVVKPPKPRVPKPKPIDLPHGHIQRFPNARFPARSNEEAKRILFDYADEEDAQFIMLAARNKEISISQLSENEQIRRPIIFSNPFTTPEPVPILPSPKPSKSGNHQRRHSSYSEAADNCVGSREGAARMIPYKRGKLTDKNSSAINYGFIEVTKKEEQAARNKQEKRRELRALQRNLAFTLGDSSLVRQNVFRFREKLLKFARSSIHGWGLFTLEDIQPNDMIIEYVGELIRPAVADVRECKYTRRGIGSSYLFRMDDDSVVDATTKGNVARFINHSCNPNCYARVIGKDEQKAICIYAKRFIARGEEVCYDYKFPPEDIKIPCYCGSPVCRLYLN